MDKEKALPKYKFHHTGSPSDKNNSDHQVEF